ncbi:MAG: hypothetical protein ACTSUB_02105, partial [Candidatus Thorarchaeota archaeon]
ELWQPFRDWKVFEGDGLIIWGSNVILDFMIVGGFLFWYFAIQYSQRESLPASSMFLGFVAGGAFTSGIIGETLGNEVSIFYMALGFGMLILEIILYARRVLATTEPHLRHHIRFYFIGFIVFLLAGPIGLIFTGTIIGDLYSIPYGVGLVMIAYSIAIDYRILFISEARSLDILILDKEGSLIFNHRFHEYDKSVDSELMGTAISGVITLMKEILASGEKLHGVDHGDTNILVESGPLTTALLIVTKETSRFRQSLRQAITEFELNYREDILARTALVSAYESFRERIVQIFL